MKMVKALVLGLGISGKSVIPFLEKRGYEVVGFDDQISKGPLPDITTFSLFVPSPGIARSHPLYKAAGKQGIEITSEAELALREIDQPCIGVTGTNGKSTVVKMIEHVLNHVGKKSLALGNIGTPLTSYSGGDEILVVELSSYQLETLQARCFDVALLLNIAEDHLDRYDSFAEYAQAKIGIQQCLKEDGVFIAHEKAAKDYSLSCQTFGGPDSNESAAFAAVSHFGITRAQFAEPMESFSPLPHRLEFVGEVSGVRYYNDSKASNVAATLRAIESLDAPIVLLLGGRNKGLSFAPLQKFSDRFRAVIAFGEAGEEIAQTLSSHLCTTVDDAVNLAHKLAKPGDIVLLAPGCTSFDAYKNYGKRGDHFKSLVFALPTTGSFAKLTTNEE